MRQHYPTHTGRLQRSHGTPKNLISKETLETNINKEITPTLSP